MIRKMVVITCISLLAAAVSAEFLFSQFDPLGVAYFTDRNRHDGATVPHPSGYAFAPGTVQLHNWSFTINEDGTRYTPGAAARGPRVVFAGDSVTFGLGVDDDEVWVSRVCADLSLRCLNIGRASYAASNVRDAVAEHEGACVVFLTIYNDYERRAVFSDYRHDPFPSALAENIWWMIVRTGVLNTPRDDWHAYTDAMAELAARENTLIIAFEDGGYGDMVRDAYSAVLVPRYTSHISFFDSHADALGNRQIAAVAAPLIAAWIEGRDCA